jgi:hypothetical protein
MFLNVSKFYTQIRGKAQSESIGGKNIIVGKHLGGIFARL